MRKTKIPAWINVKCDVQPPLLKCERCGETRDIHIPAAMDDFIKQGEAFSESHKYCKKSDGEN
jgi:hypothetical protein